jgi:hypothetical protein
MRVLGQQIKSAVEVAIVQKLQKFADGRLVLFDVHFLASRTPFSGLQHFRCKRLYRQTRRAPNYTGDICRLPLRRHGWRQRIRP